MYKSRAQLACEALKAKMQPDSDTNFGMNESYRMGLEDMVNWIDIDPESVGKTGKNT